MLINLKQMPLKKKNIQIQQKTNIKFSKILQIE